MTIKSLTITEDAYEALKRMKLKNESFSEVILRLSQEKIGAAAKFFGGLKISDKEAKEWQESIKQRRRKFNEEIEQRKQKIQRALA